MLFTSLDFALFLPIVFAAYWAIPARRTDFRNWLLLFASYIFYAWWDYRFLALILTSSVLDFFLAGEMGRTEAPKKRKLLLGISLAFNLGMLCTFKYFNFFIDSFNSAFALMGVPIRGSSLELVLPVGISFYTFRTLSFSVDVYRRKLEPCRELVHFLTYVAFFPQLVAGPIERASHLLPQFQRKSAFDEVQATDGLRQILWGLFKKMVIADNCAPIVNDIFSDYGQHNGPTLFLGAVLLAFQIYGDFSGYSDIAIGTARLFGFDLMPNFSYPYFSRDVAEFWRRWHISLSTWFRDYVYIPLGGSRGTRLLQVRNIFVVFLISGLWHGANWTFIVWGVLHALFILPVLLSSKNRERTGPIAAGRIFPSVREAFAMGSTFFLVTIAWVFFRSENVTHAFLFLERMFSPANIGAPQILPVRVLALIGIMLGAEWLARDQLHALQNIRLGRPARWACYLALGYAVVLLGARSQDFIYFQF